MKKIYHILLLNIGISIFLILILYTELYYNSSIFLDIYTISFYPIISYLIITGWLFVFKFIANIIGEPIFVKEREIYTIMTKTPQIILEQLYYFILVLRIAAALIFIFLIPFNIYTWIIFLVLQEASLDLLDSIFLSYSKHDRLNRNILLDDFIDWIVRSIYFYQYFNYWFILVIIIGQFFLSINTYYKPKFRFLKYSLPDILYFFPMFLFTDWNSVLEVNISIGFLIGSVCIYIIIYISYIRAYISNSEIILAIKIK